MKWILTPDKFLNEEEVKLLVKVCSDSSNRAELNGYWISVRDWMIVDLVLNTGLRVQEVSDLKVTDLFLNYNESTLVVQRGREVNVGSLDSVLKRKPILRNSCVRKIQSHLMFFIHLEENN